MIKLIIFLNGIYDILCSFSILFSNNYFSNIHPKLFKDKENQENPIIRRFMAYWILTYGSIRLFSGYYQNSKELLLLAYYSYLIEILAFEYELFISNSLYLYKVKFISIVSIIIIKKIEKLIK
jgi:hypothetical protein